MTHRQHRIFAAVILGALLSPGPAYPAADNRSTEPTATPPEQRFLAWERHMAMREESPFRGLSWKALGPRFTGGRVEAIDVCPKNPDTIYAGFGAGNVWKTVNGGITWKPVFEDESTFAIGALTVAPSDPDVIWVGTGENLMARSSFAGTGVFLSKDGGETWRNTGLHNTHHIGRIAVHPGDPGTAYVAALGRQYTFNKERGVFKTEDGGATWRHSLFISEQTGVVDLVMDPSNNLTLYASAWQRDRKAWNNVVCGPESGVYKTIDGGETWTKLEGGLPSGLHIGRIGLAVAASNPDVVYAVIDNLEPLPTVEGKPPRVIGTQIFRSDDKGATWMNVGPSDFTGGVNYAFGDVRVSPENENLVYVLGVNLMVSEDGGKTFRRIEGTIVHLLHHPTRALHLDHHDLWIDPQNPTRLILGNDGGVYITKDRGETWLHLNNIPVAEFYAVDVDMQTPYRIYGGTQDNAAVFGPSDRFIEDGLEDPWANVWIDLWGGGDSYFTFPDPEDPEIIYYEQQFGDMKRKDMRTGKTTPIRPKADEGEPPLRFNWMTPFFVSRHHPAVLYCGTQRLFKSNDRGDSWTAASPDLTTQPGPEKRGDVPYGTITTIGESPLRAGLLYVGTDDGRVHVTQDDGASWRPIQKELPDKWVSRIVASGHEEGTVYVSLTGYREDDFSVYLFRSDDFGETWKFLGDGLPDESVNVVREDPTDKNILYIGTDHGGVYISLDRGESWYSLRADLPMAAIHDIAVHPRDGELVIGTHGRSAFLLSIAPVREYAREIHGQPSGPRLMAFRPAVLPQRRDYGRDWAWETSRPATIPYYLDTPGPAELSIIDEEGNTLKTLSAQGRRGINVMSWSLIPDGKSVPGGVYQRGPELVPAGRYVLRLQAGGRVLEGSLEVKAPDSPFVVD